MVVKRLCQVNYHSHFFTQDPDALTQLGWDLKFYDLSLRYAPHAPDQRTKRT